LLTLGYSVSRADHWIFIWKENNKYSYLIVYVDDGGIFGSKQDIKMVIEALSKHFVVKDLGEMKTFIGYEILTNRAKDTMYIHQPKLIQHLKDEFGSLVESLKNYTTPVSPRTESSVQIKKIF
jgi:hypothetical protein